MARAPKKTSSASSGSRGGLRARKKIEYNVQKLSDKSVEVPKVPKKKAAAPKKKAAGGKKGKKGTTYLVLIKRILKNVEAPGLGLESIVKLVAAANPDRTNRRYIRLALTQGVDKKLFVKTRASWRLSKKAQDNMTRSTKKKTTKKSTKKSGTKKTPTKKKTTTKKSGAKKSTSTKKATTKKTTTKKATAKKASTKKEKAPAKKAKVTKKAAPKKRAAESDAETASPAKKKVIGPPASDDSGAVTEAVGKWQYYDGGWQNYTDDASRIVEGVYQEYQNQPDIHVRPVQSGHFSYSVNFRALEQTNTSTGTMRKIRRI